MNLYEYRTKKPTGETIEYTTEYCEKKFKEFNKKYFGGKLKTVPVYWVRTSGKNGCCKASFDIVKQQVVTKCIELSSNKLETYEAFRNTFVHEMIHYWVNSTISKEQINEANHAGKCGSRAWRKAMFWGDTLCHEGRWRQKAQEINAEFKELNILRMDGNSSLANRTATGRIKKSALTEANGLHALINTNGSRRFFTVVNDETYKSLLKKIKEGDKTWPYDGEWAEYTFDPKKFAELGVKTCTRVTQGFKMKYFDMLVREGAINKYSKNILGGEKGEPTRRRRTKSIWGF